MSASAVVLAALNQANGSASSKAFLAALAEGEGGTTFTILYGGLQWTGSLASFPQWAGVAVGNSETHAAGFAQFEPASYAEAASISGRSGFYPQDQIQNAWDYAATIFAARYGTLHDVLQTGGSMLELIPTYLISIWPGGCDGAFPSRYAENLPLVGTTATPPAAMAQLRTLYTQSDISKVSLQMGRGRKFRIRL